MAKVIINKENYFHNLKVISKQAGSKDNVAVVLKDNAYGHGLLEIAQLANEFGIKRAIVKNLKEALKIEAYFENILILADTDIHTYSHSFHITINSIEDIHKLPENTKVHLKVDTGMHRNGIPKDLLKEAIHGICSRNLKFTGLFTHHRSADILSTEFYWQKREFEDIKEVTKKLCEQLFLPLPAFHSCNSSALFRFKNFDESFARVGIASYGYIENDDVFGKVNLKPVLSLWANKISSRKIIKGQGIGYGATYQAKENMSVSTYDIGYGDGFLRINGTQNYSTPKGYNVLGRVSMDNLSLNSTDDEVCLFNDVTQLAQLHDTISYEITTTLSPELKREIR